MDKLFLAVNRELAAQPANMALDNVRMRIEAKLPHILEQHCARHDLPVVTGKIFEKTKFARLKIDDAATASDRSRYQIDLEVCDL